MADLEVRLQALDGTWETVGVDRYPGVYAEGFQAGANEWGHDTCSFVLKRPTDIEHPDLASFTPGEVYRNGVLIFDGRLKETPTTEGPDGQISVTGVGWQAHTDDDQYERTFIQTDLTTAVDNRALLQADLTVLRAAAHVEAGTGGIIIGWDNGTVMDGTGFCSCAVVDMGADPARWAKRVILDWEVVSGAGDAGFVFEIVVTDAATSPLESGRRAVYQPGNWSTVSGGTNVGGTAATPGRYVHFFCFYTTPAATLGADRIVRVKRMLIATDPAYESGGASVLKASTVITDALDQCCPLLSADRSQIQASSFNLPEFALDGPHTARDVITAANAVHRWRTRIRRGRVPEFAPQPNAPIVKVGDWGGSRFQDASAGSGEEIYNRVLVTGTGPDGTDLTVERRSPNVAPQLANPSAATNTAGWTAADPTHFARDTGQYDSPPASFRLSTAGGGANDVYAVFGSVDAMHRYRVTIAVRKDFANADNHDALIMIPPTDSLRVLSGPAFVTPLTGVGEPTIGGGRTLTIDDGAQNAWQKIVFDFVPKASDPSWLLDIYGDYGGGAWNIWFDSITFEAYDATLVDRRGFIRTKQLQIGSALTVPLANQLGDIFLATHARTPLKGSIDIQPGGLRSVATDEPIHPSELLNNTTELIRLSHLVDPDTGAVGRDGIIASVSYSEENETASVQLDNDRQSFQALLERMSTVVGSVRT